LGLIIYFKKLTEYSEDPPLLNILSAKYSKPINSPILKKLRTIIIKIENKLILKKPVIFLKLNIKKTLKSDRILVNEKDIKRKKIKNTLKMNLNNLENR
jgi:hypothetical protein